MDDCYYIDFVVICRGSHISKNEDVSIVLIRHEYFLNKNQNSEILHRINLKTQVVAFYNKAKKITEAFVWFLSASRVLQEMTPFLKMYLLLHLTMK